MPSSSDGGYFGIMNETATMMPKGGSREEEKTIGGSTRHGFKSSLKSNSTFP